MKKVIVSAAKKIRSERGESLAEVLFAMLFSALALVLLASMITASTRIISASRDRMNSYYAQNAALSGQSIGGDENVTTGTANVAISEDLLSQDESVTVSYRSIDAGITSYRLDSYEP